MTRRYFGTDGMRGKANTHPITAEMAFRLARASGQHFRSGNTPQKIVIGRDTRQSGDMLQAALVAGFTAIGADCILLGVIPTPAVAMLTKHHKASLGIMISASHNPYYDNGLKLFDTNGHKLPDATELAIEALIDTPEGTDLAAAEDIGVTLEDPAAKQLYKDALLASISQNPKMRELKIVLDCAHGAAHDVAPETLKALGASFTLIGVSPNGTNINADVGSTHIGALQSAVLSQNADVGIALDGDADRCIMVDEKGAEIDGDQLIGLIATRLHQTGQLSKAGIVTTIMSNLGLEKHLQGLGLALERTKVGDRYVTQRMREGGFNLGGEQSGHIILSDISTTGDGMLAALQVLAIMAETGKPLSQIGQVFTPAPQKLINIRYTDIDPLEADDVKAVIAKVKKRLGKSGRIVIRKSGTEPLIRIMAEAEDKTKMLAAAEDVAEAVRKAS